MPEPNGEGYFYDVKKYWLVQDVKSDGTLTVVTRRGKQRTIAASDQRLRPARWWESLFLASRFPQQSEPRQQPQLDSGRGMSLG
jgi:hypothetical protein